TALRQVGEDRAARATGPGPLVLLVARGASPEELADLARLREATDAGQVLVVLVDAVPERGTTVRLEANERVAEVVGVEDSVDPTVEALAGRVVGARLYTLGREAASELLAVLASARTDDDVVTAVVEEAEPFEVVMAESPSVQVTLLGTYRIEVGGTEIRAGLRA
ncbi:MAG TPA: hypothetical protein VHA34_18245, partial [Actinomycetes bacterium]|nr:hypothetical protein [Actinomycetes bacterium]